MVGTTGFLAYCFAAFALSVFFIIVIWKILNKAGLHGWGVLIPFYGTYLRYKLAFGSGWWFLMGLVPIANIVFAIMLHFRTARAFGKSVGFGFGIWLLDIIFMPILAFGKAEYKGAIPL